VQLLVYTYVFSIVLQIRPQVKGLPSTSLTFGFWLFAGLIPWTAFITGFLASTSSVVGQPNLVKKIVFPLELLPLVPVLSAFVESLSGLFVSIALLGITTQNVQSTLWLFPLVWIPQLLFTSGLSYLFSGLTVFLRDIPQTIGVVLNLWFYLTPIIYPASAIPERFRLWVFWLNPFTTIVELYRDLLLVGEVHHWTEWGLLWLVSLPIFLGGLFVYQRLRPAFADVL
jgi:lipopolysaccharide transport system permease protein